MRARTEARISAPSFENTPHKAPKNNLKRRIQFSDSLADVTNDNPKPKKKATGQKTQVEVLIPKYFRPFQKVLESKLLRLGCMN